MSNKNKEYLTKLLREMYPNGVEDFIPLLVDAIELHSNKNFDYARGGNPLGNFDRVGSILSLYPGLDPSKPDVVAMVYLLKQLDAALWMMANNYEGNVEGKDKRLEDVSVYTTIIRCIGRRNKGDNSNE